jgi:hypothetical protein
VSRRLLACAVAAALGAGCAKLPPAIDSFTAAPTDIPEGEPSTLTWAVRGADKLVLTPDVGEVSGTAVAVSPRVNTVYRLTASNAGGSVFREVTVSVHDPAPAAAIYAFTASPKQAAPGAAVTLAWVQAGATSLSLSGGGVVTPLAVTDTQVVVHPLVNTTYTLTAQGPSDQAPQTSSVAVRVVPPPVIVSFEQRPASPVPLGSAATLTWTANGQHYALDDGLGTHLDVGALTAAKVRPLRSGTWRLTAFGPAANSEATVDLVVTGQAAAGLAYTDPPAGSEAIRLERDPASTPARLVLLVKAARALSINALALNLPLDGAAAGARDGASRVALDASAVALPGPSWRTLSDGFDVDTAQLDPGGAGSAPPAALLRLPTAGPLAGVLTLGLAQKPLARCQQTGAACQGGKDGDAAVAAGAVLARVRLVPRAAGGAGPVLIPSQLALPLSGYRALVRGTGDTSTAFAVGALDAAP